MTFNHLILCRPVLFLPSVFPGIRVFSSELALCIRWHNYWSFSFSISPSNEYSGLISFKIDGLISLLSKGLSRVFSRNTVQKLQFVGTQPSLWSNSHICTGKTIALTIWTFVGKVTSQVFNTPSRFVIDFLPRSKRLNFMAAVTGHGARKIKFVTVFNIYLSICHEVMGPDAMILVFWMFSFKLAFSLSSFTFIKRYFSSSLLSAIRVLSSAYLKLLIFLSATLIPAWDSSSQAFHIIYSAYKLNKQDDNIQPWCTPFPIWNQSVVPCLVLIVASWPAYRFLRRWVRWSGIPISWRIFHSLLWSTQSKILA